jgi:prevent-host-death family protein
MRTMTAKDAKSHFGEFLDAMQREPVIVTKNNRPVGIMISMEDASDTLISDMFMEKEAGYDAWLMAKVKSSQAALHSGTSSTTGHAQVMDRVWTRLQAKAHTQTA